MADKNNVPQESPEELRRSQNVIRRVVLSTVGVALLVSTIGYLWRQTPWGEAFERYTIAFLQLRLKEVRSGWVPLRVVVIDIHDWPPVPPNNATSRPALQRLLNELRDARAVGIDVDFSPEDAEYIDPGDPDFFAFCRCLEGRNGKRLPVFLGVGRTAGTPSFRWLGNHDFWDLAASMILRPNTSLIPRGLVDEQSRSSSPSGETDKKFTECEGNRRVVVPEDDGVLPSLSFALAHVVDRTLVDSLERPLPGLERLKPRSIPGAEEFSVNEFWLDGAIAVRARDTQLSVSRALMEADPILSSDMHSRVAGKVVLIGDHEVGANDVMPLANDDGGIAGVYVHAAAIQTLLEKPLASFTKSGAFCVDLILTFFALSILVFGIVQAKATKAIRLTYYLPWFVAGFVLFVAVIMIGWLRFLWIDFPLVIAGTLLHNRIEEGVESVWSMARAFWAYLSRPAAE